MTLPVSLAWLVLIGVASPCVLLLLLCMGSLLRGQLSERLAERWTAWLAASAMTLAFACLIAAFAVYSAVGMGPRLLSYGGWSAAHGGGIAVQFLVDRLSLGFAALSAAILGVVSAFSNRYLHREAGYHRYFVLLAMFAAGMLLLALAGNVEVLLAGWEFVGLSSALLVAYFHQRPAPVSNALHVFSVYRVGDVAMLAAVVLLRHVAGNDSLALLFGSAPASAVAALSQAAATVIAVLLLVAVAAKSALLPFSSWLPRAMEGPTPSSAVYYGSLSIHAGCFLLLRSAPLLEHAPLARMLAAGLGAATAIFAGLTTRVQSDVKSSLAYASLTQVGLIVMEIAFGWYHLAFLHLAGHACFRLLQFLTAPNILHDLHGMEDALPVPSSRSGGYAEAILPAQVRHALYLFALERGFLDGGLDRLLVTPFSRVARRLTALDSWLAGALLSPRPTGVAAAEVQDE